MKKSKIINVLTSSALTSTLVLSLGTTAFANENESIEDTETVTTIELPEELTNVSLVPGDYFYFVKKMIEDIRLAVTVDEYEEAKLLAKYAAERLAEANALIEEGKMEEAEKLIQEALETQQLAEEKMPETEEVVSEEAEDESINSEATEEQQEATVDLVVVEEQEGTEEQDETETTEDVENVELDDVIVIDEPVEKEVEKRLANNIDALVAVLAKIENPRAKEAIMKNIQKSFAKLDKKISKFEDISLEPIKEVEETVKAEEEVEEKVTEIEIDQETTVETDETQAAVVKKDEEKDKPNKHKEENKNKGKNNGKGQDKNKGNNKNKGNHKGNNKNNNGKGNPNK